ncbi:probable E3 ubiquitin-protein ligase RHB1A [Chenopodium quinoa]|uniref:probable E3 ubiquitin-protein ligase RHB1A n=1 Tax=Chenopodium quinoa TaxID=63459 RepID=UPI000B799E13|nr:probable E3 ubiquitin-protein ligase RHB1A [Chenopodium quinoa]
MGGCCCCCFSSRRSEPVRTPTYYYCPRTSEEREPLSANRGIPAGLAGGLLVDTNLDTSSPDTYTPPPAPIPYDVDLGRPRTPHGRENHLTKNDTTSEIANSGTEEGQNNADSSENQEKKEIDEKTKSVMELTLSEDSEDDLKKPIEQNLTIIEEEDCPICLEEYTEENPKMLTKCEHHFHLCCILEWMERSETCPVCDKEMVFDEDFNI